MISSRRAIDVQRLKRYLRGVDPTLKCDTNLSRWLGRLNASMIGKCNRLVVGIDEIQCDCNCPSRNPASISLAAEGYVYLIEGRLPRTHLQMVQKRVCKKDSNLTQILSRQGVASDNRLAMTSWREYAVFTAGIVQH